MVESCGRGSVSVLMVVVEGLLRMSTPDLSLALSPTPSLLFSLSTHASDTTLLRPLAAFPSFIHTDLFVPFFYSFSHSLSTQLFSQHLFAPLLFLPH